MNSFKSMSLKEKMIYLLTLVYLLLFFILIAANMLFSMFQTTYMDLYLDTEKPLYKSDHPILLIALVLFLIAGLTYCFKKKEITTEICSAFEKFSLIWAALISLFIIFCSV